MMSDMSYNQPRVLLVDDEPSLLFSLTAFLEDESYHVQSTSTGEDALHILKYDNFDAVIIDIGLPGMDGNEVMLEAIESGCTARFLIHTGSADYQLPQELEAYGISQNDIFLKPIADLDILCQALKQCSNLVSQCVPG
jgi:DNA-binding response OmpR family regulator